MKHYLIIGLGGTGISTVSFLKDKLDITAKSFEIQDKPLNFSSEILLVDATSDIGQSDDDFFNLGGIINNDSDLDYTQIIDGGLERVKNLLEGGAGGLTPAAARALLINNLRTNLKFKEFIISRIQNVINNVQNDNDRNREIEIIICFSVYGSTGIGLAIDYTYYIEDQLKKELESFGVDCSMRKIGFTALPHINSLRGDPQAEEKISRSIIALEILLARSTHPTWIFNSLVENVSISKSIFDMFYAIDNSCTTGREGTWWESNNNILDPSNRNQSSLIVGSEFLFNIIVDSKFSSVAFDGIAYQSTLDTRLNGFTIDLDDYPYIMSFGLKSIRYDHNVTIVYYISLLIQSLYVYYNNLKSSVNEKILKDISKYARIKIDDYIKKYRPEQAAQKTLSDLYVKIPDYLKFKDKIKIYDLINKLRNHIKTQWLFISKSKKAALDHLDELIKESIHKVKNNFEDFYSYLYKLNLESENLLSVISSVSDYNLPYCSIAFDKKTPDINDINSFLKATTEYILSSNTKSISSLFNDLYIKVLPQIPNLDLKKANEFPFIHLDSSIAQNVNDSVASYPVDTDEKNIAFYVYSNLKFSDLNIHSGIINSNGRQVNVRTSIYQGTNLNKGWLQKFKILDSFNELKPKVFVDVLYPEIKKINDPIKRHYIRLEIRKSFSVINLQGFINQLYNDEYIERKLSDVIDQFDLSNRDLRAKIAQLYNIPGSGITYLKDDDNLALIGFKDINLSKSFVMSLLISDEFFELWYIPWKDTLGFKNLDINMMLNTICSPFLCKNCKSWAYNNQYGYEWCIDENIPFYNRDNLGKGTNKFKCFKE